MTRQRKCRSVVLSKQPLVLVLCQVRFSPIRQIADYIGKIQEVFRRNQFPLEEPTRNLKQISFSKNGLQVTEQQGWEYRTVDGRWSITIQQDSVALQCTNYTSFEEFAKRLDLAVTTVLSITEHQQYGRIERVGLRYIDLLLPKEKETHREYLQPGFHGASDKVFAAGSARVAVENVGQTGVAKSDDLKSHMILRITQNDLGYDLPPDALEGAPKYVKQSKHGQLVTIVDMDHFIEGNVEANTNWVLDRAYELHDILIETFHESVVTSHAIKEWT